MDTDTNQPNQNQAHEQGSEQVVVGQSGMLPQVQPVGDAAHAQPAAMPQAPQQPVQNTIAVPPPGPIPAIPGFTEEKQDELDADDDDLIEKEWVERAKSVIQKTKDDPHSQNKELNRFKADYVKKRYNKELKVNEG